METNTIMTRWVKNLRVLIVALIISGSINIGFIAAFVFSVLQERQTALSVAFPAKVEGKQETTMQQILAQMSKLSFHELVPFLTNRDPIEEGYLKRDLAVAALCSFHQFNLEKALSSLPSQRRILNLDENRQVEIFPALTDDQFEAIIRFAYEEKWPLTSEGIFKLLKNWPEPKDTSLVQAFFVTPEFHALQVLFQKTEAPQEPALLLQLVLEGNWDILDRFAREQQQMLDLSVEKRRRLLLSYLALKSSTAAHLLLKTDFLFVLKRLEDRGAIDLLSLLKEKTEEGERLCIDLLKSPRSDAVWQAAATCLYRFSKETVPDPFDLKAAITRFAPGIIPSPVQAPPPVPAIRMHVVKEGESLWKIARQYKVKLEDIVKLNELEKDRLYPGMTLRIPN